MSVHNLVSEEKVVFLTFLHQNVPSTSEVSSVTWAAFLLPAGSDKPIFSNLSRKLLPPFLDLALTANKNRISEHLCLVWPQKASCLS